MMRARSGAARSLGKSQQRPQWKSQPLWDAWRAPPHARTLGHAVLCSLCGVGELFAGYFCVSVLPAGPPGQRVTKCAGGTNSVDYGFEHSSALRAESCTCCACKPRPARPATRSWAFYATHVFVVPMCARLQPVRGSLRCCGSAPRRPLNPRLRGACTSGAMRGTRSTGRKRRVW